QNYPNPFNPSTTISYQIPSSSFVTLKVYDVLGNEVAVLVNEWQEAGSYNAQFTTSNKQLASGMYFYTLTADKFTDTKKFILLK
ncbi:MAG: T9SS type A sorting domain-containing protein, partial [Ignavibacteria bacterium]|nr:T9SS type A sorting domain-containing protein [Ignavibacteria bacterium]